MSATTMIAEIPEIPGYEDVAEYQGVRLDLDYIASVAVEVAKALRHGDPIEVAFQPGDGTFYGLIFTPIAEPFLHTASPRVKDGVEWERRAVVSLVEGAGGRGSAYPLALGPDRSDLHPSYVHEHWTDNRAGAWVLAILFTAIVRAGYR